MNKITEITRRDIQDVITSGFYVKELIDPTVECDVDFPSGKFNIYMPFFGRISEMDFLNRLYNLHKMPSYDRRFSTAYDDIYQHTVNNYDWGDFWFFTDARFELSHGDGDENLLRFICEMLHPAVLKPNSPFLEYVKKFNEILHADGYELYIEENISGRDIYKYREINNIEIKKSTGNKFYPLKMIGYGSYANVYKYKDDFYNQSFVLKRAKKDLTEKELERFKIEYQQMSDLNSPYVVKVYRYNVDSNDYIMECMDCTLLKYMERNNSTISLSTRRSIILQLFKAYNYIHSKGIFHRDISPNNVLIKEYDDTLIVKISDFGLVKRKESDLTSENTEFKGSFNDPALRIDGFKNYMLTHEIYALTLLCAYVLTGKKEISSIKNIHIKEFVSKGTNPDTTKRYQSLDEMREHLLDCISKIGV